MTSFSKFPEESRTEGERETIKQRINRLIAICLYGVGNEGTSAEGKNQDFSDTDDFINGDDDDGDTKDGDDDVMDDSDDDGFNDGSGISDNDDDNIGADDRHFGHEPGHSHCRRRRRHRHNFSQLHWIQQPDLYEEFEFNPTSGNGLFETCTNEQ